MSGATVGGAGWNGVSLGGSILTAPNVANRPLLAYDDGSGTKRGQPPISQTHLSGRIPVRSRRPSTGEKIASSTSRSLRCQEAEEEARRQLR